MNKYIYYLNSNRDVVKKNMNDEICKIIPSLNMDMHNLLNLLHDINPYFLLHGFDISNSGTKIIAIKYFSIIDLHEIDCDSIKEILQNTNNNDDGYDIDDPYLSSYIVSSNYMSDFCGNKIHIGGEDCDPDIEDLFNQPSQDYQEHDQEHEHNN